MEIFDTETEMDKRTEGLHDWGEGDFYCHGTGNGSLAEDILQLE